jgi:hypothetical protein
MRRTVIGLVLLVHGCNHSSATEASVAEALQRTLSYAAGHTEPHPDTVGVTLRGQLLVMGPAGTGRLPYTRVTLLHAGRAIATVATDGAGDFYFKNRLAAGEYELTLDSGAYEGGLHFEVGCVGSVPRKSGLTERPRACI